MMATYTKYTQTCDRCSAQYASDKDVRPRGWTQIYRGHKTDEPFDLCDGCTNCFKLWMTELKTGVK